MTTMGRLGSIWGEQIKDFNVLGTRARYVAQAACNYSNDDRDGVVMPTG